MRKFGLYWGEHSMRTRCTIQELLEWGERFLHDCHANVFDGYEYIATIRVGERGSFSYYRYNNPITRDNVIRMCEDATTRPVRYYVEWYEHNRPYQVWFRTKQEQERYIRTHIPCGVIFTTWSSEEG